MCVETDGRGRSIQARFTLSAPGVPCNRGPCASAASRDGAQGDTNENGRVYVNDKRTHSLNVSRVSGIGAAS